MGILFQGVVDVILPGHPVKRADVLARYLDIGQLILLAGQVFQGLLAPENPALSGGPLGRLGFHRLQQFVQRRLQDGAADPAALDADRNRFFVQIILHGSLTSNRFQKLQFAGRFTAGGTRKSRISALCLPGQCCASSG